jgi:hypothetical protein
MLKKKSELCLFKKAFGLRDVLYIYHNKCIEVVHKLELELCFDHTLRNLIT